MSRHGLFSIALLSFTFASFVESSAQPSAPVKTQIAVLELEGRGISATEVATLTDRLRGHLVNTSAFVVLDRGNMEEILKEFGFQQSGCTSTECAVEVGKMLNVQKMVTGSIGHLGKTFTLDISITDVETSRIERSLSKDYRGEIDGLLEVLKVIAYELAGIKGTVKAPPLASAKTKPLSTETKKLYKLTIASSPTGAEVIVNDRTIGITPIVRRAAAGGRFRIVLRYPGYQDWEKSVTMLSEQALDVEMARLDEAMAGREKDAESQNAKPAKSSPRKWLYIAGGAVAVGAAVLVASSGGDDGAPPQNLPGFKWPPPE